MGCTRLMCVWVCIVATCTHDGVFAQSCMLSSGDMGQVPYALSAMAIGGVCSGLANRYIQSVYEQQRDNACRNISTIRFRIQQNQNNTPLAEDPVIPCDDMEDLYERVSRLRLRGDQCASNITRYCNLFHETSNRLYTDAANIEVDLYGTPAYSREVHYLTQQCEQLKETGVHLLEQEEDVQSSTSDAIQVARIVQRTARIIYNHFAATGISHELKIKAENRYTRICSRAELLKEYVRSLHQAVDHHREIEQVCMAWSHLSSQVCDMEHAARKINTTAYMLNNTADCLIEDADTLHDVGHNIWIERAIPAGLVVCGACIGYGVYAICTYMLSGTR